MYECHSQYESRLSSACNPENELSPLTHVDQCPCKSCRIPGESSPHFWSVQKKSMRFVVTQSSLCSDVSHELVPCCCTFNVSCHFPQCCHPVTRVAWSAISSFYSSTTSVFHDISLPRHQSSTTSVKFFSLVTTSAWLQLLFLTDCKMTRARPSTFLPSCGLQSVSS